MRSCVLPAIAMAASLLSACTSSGVADALDVAGTSSQTTGSIDAAAPVPSQSVSLASEIALSEDPQLPAANAAIEEQVSEPVQTAMVRPSPSPAKASLGSHGRVKVYPPRFRDAKPVSFGRIKPEHYNVHGVDVSRWQGDIDWATLRKQGANFAYIKATEGDDHTDALFRRNWDAADKAGIPRGAYHFFYWCSKAETQADWFIRHVPKDKGALPPVIDVEWNSHSRTCKHRPPRAVVLKKMKVFMNKVERHYGQKPVIYTAPDFYADNLKGEFKDYSFWLRSVAAHPKSKYPGRDFAFWQYSGTGLSASHDTQIDLNVFNGNEKSWRRWLNQRTH